MKLMSRSWKTSICGIAGAVFSGAALAPQIPPWLNHILIVLSTAANSLGLMFARDNNRTSEQVGAHKNGQVKVVVPPTDPNDLTTTG